LRCRLLALVLVAAAPSRAHAFADATQFFAQQANPHAATLGASGEGLYFTGAPRFASLTCNSCHVGGPGAVGLRLGADHPELFTDGYTPGQTYELEVELTNETAGTQFNTPTCTDPPGPNDKFSYVQCNNNGFGLEIDSSDGPLKGGFCARPWQNGACPPPDFTSDESLVAPDGDAIFSDRVYSADPNTPKLVERNGATKWHLYWTAPAAHTGPLTIYIAAVDGNGGSGTAANDQDPFGDDTVQANFFVQEAGAPAGSAASAGCGVAPAAARSRWLLVVLVFAALGARRSSLRWRSSLRRRRRPTW
jgi:hypothetical protein